MTNGRAPKSKELYTLTWLPWLLGLLVFGCYLVTVNRSISFVPDWTGIVPPPLQQAPVGVRMTGWVFGAEFLAPVYYLVTFPLRWLPEQFIPIALNLFSALCGALALVLLAKSVALLPHDRTRDQREREDDRHSLLTIPWAWLPPVFATVVCALGLSFWEHGTNGTAEMFDLLLFAYVLRNLLEYRRDEKENRLLRAAFVYGAAITNNLAMIAFFPIFIIVLVWMRKLSFFNLKFLGRMSLCGLAGLSFYLLLPVIGSLAKDQPLSFWQLLTANLQAQRWLLFGIPKMTILLLSLTTLIPVFLLSIRWSSQFGDPSRVGVLITTIAFHLCHTVILVACLWMMLDPEFSPRKVGFGLAFLPLYYLGALSVGYYSGYLLLVSRTIPNRFRQPPPLALLIQRLTTAAIFILLVGVPGILIHRNLPQIRLTNGPLQKQFASQLAANLPPTGVIISDEPRRLWLLQEWLGHHDRAKDFIVLCSQWLPVPQYHKYLARRYPQWTPPSITDDTKPIADGDLAALIEKLGKEKDITYLHPSFGYYFEYFTSQPDGLTHRLLPQPETSLVPPPLSAEVIARNQKFWAAANEGIFELLLPVTVPRAPTTQLTAVEKFYRNIGLKPEKNLQAMVLASFISRSLVSWAVELQKSGDYEAAASQLELAQKLNPKNVAASINLAFNKRFRNGQPINLQFDRAIEEYFGESRSWEQVLTLNGPFDDPSLSFAQGYVFARGNLIRQAAQAFDRTRVQATNDVTSRLWLAQLHLNRNLPDRTLEMIREIQLIAARDPALSTNLNDLFTLEAAAHLTKNEDAIATTIIEANLSRRPNDFNLLASACKAYADNRRYPQALDLTDRMLKLDPNNIACLINRGCFLMEVPDFERAIQSFSKVLTLETNNSLALLYRGIANLRADKLDAASEDYESVQRQFPKAPQVDYGLGEIAYRRKDTNAAIRHYESYLLNAPPQTAEAEFIKQRIDELKGLKPEKPTEKPK
jgi:tetratricopeptide (TPR) repeat protein